MENRIDAALSRLRGSGTAALAPFVTFGYPDPGTSLRIARAALDAGGDLLELGVPFSDPLADGPTIQMTSARALANGVTVERCVEAVRELREGGASAPIVLMGYVNPFLSYGIDRLARDAAAAGADGLIVPDLPTEESGPLAETCRAEGIHLVPLLAPTSTEERIASACAGAGGFIYCVSLTGVTGARGRMATGAVRLVERIRAHSDLPVLVGFGISRPEHVAEVSAFADGAVFASAMLDAIDRSPTHDAAEVAARFVHSLRGSGEPAP